MKYYLSHPYKGQITINIGQFTQVIGQNQQLKYYIWQLLIWYFDGKKYSEEDLNVFHQAEPEIRTDSGLVKRSAFKIISITDIRDLIKQMSYQKGTVAFDFMKSIFRSVDVISEVDEINNKLEHLSVQINQHLNLTIDGIDYHTESSYVNAEQLLSKNFTPYFKQGNQNIAFEFVDNETKFFIFLNMLETKLASETESILLILKNMDDYLRYQSFRRICEKMSQLCRDFPHFYVMIFPSNEGYLYSSRESIEFINILSDLTEHLYDIEFLYERFSQKYPSNNIPTQVEFLELLRRNASYFFSEDIVHVSLGGSDLVMIKIMNQLYHYDKKLDYSISALNPLECQFLND